MVILDAWTNVVAVYNLIGQIIKFQQRMQRSKSVAFCYICALSLAINQVSLFISYRYI